MIGSTFSVSSNETFQNVHDDYPRCLYTAEGIFSWSKGIVTKSVRHGKVSGFFMYSFKMLALLVFIMQNHSLICYLELQLCWQLCHWHLEWCHIDFEVCMSGNIHFFRNILNIFSNGQLYHSNVVLLINENTLYWSNSEIFVVNEIIIDASQKINFKKFVTNILYADKFFSSFLIKKNKFI